MNMCIQTNKFVAVGPCSMNRDGNGRNKIISYGGWDRIRIASQALNRKYRDVFNDLGETIATRYVVEILTNRFTEKNPEASETDVEEFRKAAAALVEANKEYITQILAYSQAEIDAVYGFLCGMDKATRKAMAKDFDSGKCSDTTKKQREKCVEEVKGAGITLEIAIFGRMCASGIGYNVMSARRTSHAYSVDEYADDMDYFTTLDTYLRTKDENGGRGEAAFIGSGSSIASNVIYMYSCIDPIVAYDNMVQAYEHRGVSTEELRVLKEEAVDAVAKGVARLVRIILTTMPDGKQSSMATNPIPSLALVSVSKDSVNITMDNCFEKIIRADESKSVMEKAADRVFAHLANDRVGNYIADFCLTDSQIGEYISKQEQKKDGGFAVPETVDVHSFNHLDDDMAKLEDLVREALWNHIGKGGQS